MIKQDKIFISLLLLLLLTGSIIYLIRVQNVTASLKSITLPIVLADWGGRDIELSEAALGIIKPDAYVFREYNNSKGQSVTLFIGFYKNMHNSDASHSPLICYPAQGWEIVENKDVGVSVSGRTLEFSRIYIIKDNLCDLVMFSYATSDITSNKLAKIRFNLIKNRILGVSTINYFIRLSSPLSDNDKESAQKVITTFIQDFYPILDNIGK
jgi:EpsI family protein